MWWTRCHERGQATLEYVLVLFAFLSLVVAMATLWRATNGGVLVREAHHGASHGMQKGLDADVLQDVLAY